MIYSTKTLLNQPGSCIATCGNNGLSLPGQRARQNNKDLKGLKSELRSGKKKSGCGLIYFICGPATSPVHPTAVTWALARKQLFRTIPGCGPSLHNSQTNARTRLNWWSHLSASASSVKTLAGTAGLLTMTKMFPATL